MLVTGVNAEVAEDWKVRKAYEIVLIICNTVFCDYMSHIKIFHFIES